MICCLASAACPLRDTAAPLAACGGRKGIRAVYCYLWNMIKLPKYD